MSALRRILVASTSGGLAAALLIAIADESPIHVLKTIAGGAFGSSYDAGFTLFYAASFALAALAVTLGLKVKLFNIGVEGQLTVAALAAAVTGIIGPQDPLTNRLLACGAALVAGGLWGALLGYLRSYRGAHEVVAGIMLNFIAYGLTSWVALNYYRNPEGQNPETLPIAEALKFQPLAFMQNSPVTWLLLGAPITAALVFIYYRCTKAGFQNEVIGANPLAASFHGLSLERQQFWALAAGGVIAGMVGYIEVYGNSGRFIVGFSPGYGFIGAAVALIAGLNPFGILLAALLLGGLHKGSLDLEFETEWLTRDFAQILQAVLILFMSCKSLWPASWRIFGKARPS